MQRRCRAWCLALFTFGVAACSVAAHALFWPSSPLPASQTRAGAANLSPDSVASSLISIYCSACHVKGRSGVDLDGSKDLAGWRRERSVWQHAVSRLRARAMPPTGYPQLDDADREFLINWLEDNVIQSGLTEAERGNLMVRRLTRIEYVHAIRDLFGVAFEPSADFPKDDPGWDRCREAPELPEKLADSYRAAANAVLERLEFPATEDMALEVGGPYRWNLLADVAQRAFGRPLDGAEVGTLYAIVECADGEGMSDDPLKLALAEILVSPQFLYRSERLPDTAYPTWQPADEFALAARLASFLWASVPDEELLIVAHQGRLKEQVVSQTERMLRDPRAQNFGKAFAHHWLGLGALDLAADLDPTLRAALQNETERFTQHVVSHDRNVLEFLDANYTFLNETLARHYGIAGVQGDHWQQVPLTGTGRGGLVTQAGVITVMAPLQVDTSPVNRGKWILENLLGQPRIAPPPGILAAFASGRNQSPTRSIQEALAQHRSDASCAACHAKMDALGLALENFDARGVWRTTASDRPVDASSVLPDGQALSGPGELKDYLCRQREHFLRGLAGKLLTFALGREIRDDERASLRNVPARTAARQDRFSILVQEVVQSEAFLKGWSAGAAP